MNITLFTKNALRYKIKLRNPFNIRREEKNAEIFFFLKIFFYKSNTLQLRSDFKSFLHLLLIHLFFSFSFTFFNSNIFNSSSSQLDHDHRSQHSPSRIAKTHGLTDFQHARRLNNISSTSSYSSSWSSSFFLKLFFFFTYKTQLKVYASIYRFFFE